MFWKDFYWWILEEWWGAILGGKMMLSTYHIGSHDAIKKGVGRDVRRRPAKPGGRELAY